MRVRPSVLIALGAWSVISGGPVVGGDDPATDPVESFEPLFNGADLAGWVRFGGDPKAEAWTVEDGLLVSQGHGGGWLGTERDYANFVLRLDFRLAPGSNSGVYLRAPAEASHISRTGLEIQLLDEEAERHRDIQPWQKTGSIYHVAAAKTGYLRPPGTWNQLEIVAEGPRVIVRLNGETIVDDRLDQHPELEHEHPGLKRRTGRIGLQSHNDRVEFRNVGIRGL